MALKSTIFKAELQISNMDKNYYQNHALTIAQHPSETNERMMIRVLAFAIYASENLQFTKGLSADDEPDIWQKNLRDEIELWIDLGQPDEKRIRKACGRAEQVVLFTYGGSSADVWWKKISDKLTRFNNLTVISISQAESTFLASMVERTMQLQCTIEQGQVWLSMDDKSAEINPVFWQRAG